MEYTRYAIFYAPPADAPWAQFGARWLGWDMVAGAECARPDLPDLTDLTDLPDLTIDEITRNARKYGLHGTIKPPFRLAGGFSRGDLETACAKLGKTLAPVTLSGLGLSWMGRFLALCPVGDIGSLNHMAATCVRELDRFRAPAGRDELARRRSARLSAQQEVNLRDWGYPYVLNQFRFHITLTGRLPRADGIAVQSVLERELTPLLPKPLGINDLALVGEDRQGRFCLLARFALTGR